MVGDYEHPAAVQLLQHMIWRTEGNDVSELCTVRICRTVLCTCDPADGQITC